MNRVLLSKAFGDIEECFIAEAYRQPDTEAGAGVSEGRSRIRTKRILTIAVAAALYIALGAAVCAAFNGSWLSTYFASRQKAALSPRQQEYLDSGSVEISQSQTVDGYTVTVESAICDRTELCLVLRIEGPEGMKIDLDQKKGEGSLWFHSIKYASLGTYERTGGFFSYSTHGYHLPDGDGLDNTARLVLMTQRYLSPDSNQVFTDGELWRLRLKGLYTMTGEITHSEIWTDLVDGEWEFVFPLTEQSEELEMITSPVASKALYGGEGKEKQSAEVIVTSFKLRPLGASCEFRHSPDYPGVLELSEVYLMMKNGDTVPLWVRSGDTFSGKSIMYFEYDSAPILLDEIESLVLPDDVIVPCPGNG